MKVILKRELASYFNSFTGYIYLGVFFLLSSYYFVMGNLIAGSNSVAEYFQNMIVTLMFLIPILTMRSFAEEKKQRTDQLLFTLPIKVSTVIIGKILAAYLTFLVGIAATFVYVIIIAATGNVDIYTTIGCYVGIVIAGLTFITLGVLISSLTDSQTTAAILTYAVLFSLYLVSYVSSYTTNSVLLLVVNAIAIFSRFNELTVAVFDPSTIIYYLSLAFLFYELTLFSLTRNTLD